MKVSFVIIEVGSASCRLLVRSSTGSILEDQKFSPVGVNESVINTLTEALIEATRFQPKDMLVVISSGAPPENDEAVRKIVSAYPRATLRRLSGDEEAKLGVKAVQLALSVPVASVIVDLGSSAQLTLTNKISGDNQVLSFRDMGFNAIQKAVPTNKLKEQINIITDSMWGKLRIEEPIPEVVATGSMPLFILLILDRYNGNPLKNTGDPLAVTGQRLTKNDLDDTITHLSLDPEADSLTFTSKTGERIQLSRKMNLAYAYQLKRILELANVNFALLCTYEWRHAISWDKKPLS